MLFGKWLISLSLAMIFASGGLTSPCPATYLGETDLANHDGAYYLTLSQQTVVTDTDYVAQCCGYVVAWDLSAVTTGDIYFQVWRPTGGALEYELIGEKAETIATSGIQGYTYTGSHRIAIQPNDTIGWYTPGYDIVMVTTGSSSYYDGNYRMTESLPSVGSVLTLSGQVTDLTHAIYATLGPGDAPVFSSLDHSMTSAFLDLSTSVSVYTVFAFIDFTGNPTYSLTSVTPSTHFTITSSNGAGYIYPTSDLTAGTYTLTVRATDPCGNTGDGTLTIDVTNTDPVLSNLDHTISQHGSLFTTSVTVYTVTATDTDVGDSVTYSLNSVTPTTDFTIDTTTGDVSPNTTLTPGTYTLTVRATDLASGYVEGTLTIDVTNANPVFTNLDNTLSQSHSLFPTSVTVYTVTATDTDVGDSVTYSLNSVTPTTDFIIDATTGDVSPTTTLTVGTYTLSVRATDLVGGYVDGILTIGVTNTDPVIQSLPAAVDVSESAVDETLLHSINVTDSEGGSVTCTISSSPSGPFTLKFVYVQGILSNAVYLTSQPGLSHTTTSSYEITVTCTDDLGGSDAESLYVYVTKNNVPVIENLQNSTNVVSSLAVNSEVFTILASDPEGDQMTFGLTCVSPASPCPFNVYSTGAILLASTLVGSSATGYELDITVSDGTTTSGAHRLTIFISDHDTAPVISNLPSTVQLTEDLAIGSSVFTVSFTDEDGDSGHAYSYSFSPASGASLFATDTSTGAITLSSALNYLTQPKNYSVSVTVADQTNTSAAAVLTIEIVEVNQSPVLYQTNYHVEQTEGSAGTEFPAPGYNVWDPDGDTLTYSFGGGNTTSGFSINSTTGNIAYTVDMDYEDTSRTTQYVWLVVISDPESLSVTATLTVSILDENDNVPQFSSDSYSATTYSDVPLGTTILTVNATDDDVTPAYAELVYSTVSSNQLRVNNKGEVFVYGSLSSFENTEISVTVQVSNPGSTSNDSASIQVYVYKRGSDEEFFDNGSNVAWVVLTCVFAPVLVGGLAYLSYIAYTKWTAAASAPTPIKQVAPYDTKPPQHPSRPITTSTNISNVSTSSNGRVTPSDVTMTERRWNAWGNSSPGLRQPGIDF